MKLDKLKVIDRENYIKKSRGCIKSVILREKRKRKENQQHNVIETY